jgi:hypothetical protein
MENRPGRLPDQVRDAKSHPGQPLPEGVETVGFDRQRALHDRPTPAVIVVLILDTIVVYGIGLLAELGSLGYLPKFLLSFATRTLTWLLLVPLLLGLPNGKVGVLEHVQRMGLLKTTPARRIGLLSFVGIGVTCLSLWIRSLLSAIGIPTFPCCGLIP